ncbi:MAG: CRTAC1 family protein [Planctomycetes bacterium]|nr:CRTAC1 family protein [Planctomycetota bacterium]
MPRRGGAVWRHFLLVVLFGGLLGYAWFLSHRRGSAQPAQSSPFHFREVSADRGLVFQHRAPDLDSRLAPILPQIAGTGAAIAIGDANGDGWMDIYVVTSRGGESNGLFVNDGKGGFVDRSAEAGVGAVNENGRGVSHGALWADLDRDGDQDLFVYMWGQSRLFRNDSDAAKDTIRFTDVTTTAGLVPWMNCATACFTDFDRDGDLDLFLGGYYRESVNLWAIETTRILHNDQEFAENGGRNFFLRNDGGLTFTDVSDEVGLGSTRWTYGVGAADLDGDGWQDLYVANDYGEEEFYRNVPIAPGDPATTRGFELQKGLGLDAKAKSGMSVTLGDITNKGNLAVYVTNISQPGWLMQGNNLRLVRPGGAFALDNVADGDTANCGWAWGADFGDLDLDGWQDLVVVNGFRSKNPKREYWYQMSKLATGTGSLLEDAANWTPFEDMSLSGYQRTRVLINRKRGYRFRDIGEAAGVTDLYDGRAVALCDFRNEGALDMLVANQEGPLLLYENELKGGRWIGLTLVGRSSNPDGVGALVTAHFGTSVQSQVVTAGQGFCTQTDPRVHFGLGDEPLHSIQITWPSGIVQTLTSPAINAYRKVVEPAP